MVSQRETAVVRKHSSSETTEVPASELRLGWTVHLIRRNPGALPKIASAMLAAALLATMLFHSPVFGLIALVLLVGSVREYLFPVAYDISPKGVSCRFPGTHLELAWKDSKRCIVEAQRVTVTSVPVPGRLDVFRGVSLMFASQGEAGERAQVMHAIKHYAPHLLPDGIEQPQ